MTRKLILLTLTTMAMLTACRPVADVAYFQPGRHDSETDSLSDSIARVAFLLTAEHIIRPNDILSIYVSSLSPEASSFFNAIAPIERNEMSTASSFTTRTDIGYLVDQQGRIDLPLIGKIKVGGLSTFTAKDTLTRRLEQFLQSPSVRIYVQNFKVTILGEVNRPGVYTVTNEKINVIEAIGLAGDLNIFANRKNITLIREDENGKQFIPIDLTKRDLFKSPYFQLKSGDIVYAEPVSGRVAQSDNFYRVTPLIISTLTLIAVLATRLIGTN